VTGQVRLIPDANTSAMPPVPFSLPAEGSRAFPNVLSTLGPIAAPAILAVESSDTVRLSSIPLRIAYPERPLTVPIRFNPSAPNTGTLVLGILSGLVRVTIYEHPTASGAPLVTHMFSNSGEQVTRLRYADLLPAGVAISDGSAEVIPLSGQAIAVSLNAPTRRRAAGAGITTPQPILSIAGSPACEFTTGVHASVSLVAGATYRWTLFNAAAQGVAEHSIDLSLGGAGYSTLVLDTAMPSSASTVDANIRIDSKPLFTSGTATSVTLGEDATISWTLAGGAPTSQTLSGTDFAAETLAPAATSKTYRPTTTGLKSWSVSADNSCGGGSVSGTYSVSAVCTAPGATVSGSAAICAGSSTTISAALTGTGPWNVQWSDGVAQNGVVASPAVRSVSPSATTNYTVISVSDASCSGTSSGNALVTVNALPVITSFAATPNAVLFGDQTTITFTIANGSSWSLASAKANGVFPFSGTTNGSLSSTYSAASDTGADKVTLTVTNSCGTITQTLCVYVNLSILDAPASVCPGSAGHVGGTEGNIPGASYAWTIAGGTITEGQGTGSITWTAGTGASVQLGLTTTLSNGCAPTTDTKVIPIKVTPPDATITTAGSTCASSTGNSASVPNPADFRSTFVWSITNGTITGGQGTRFLSYTAGASGTTQLNVTVTDYSSGCAATGNATVTIKPLPTAAVSGTATVCAGATTPIQAVLTGTGPWNVQWSDGAGQTVSTSPAVRNVGPSSTTTYTVVSVTDANGCAQAGTGSAVITPTQNHAPAISSFTANPTTINFGEGSTLTFTITNGATWALNSSIGNTFSQASGTGSGTFTVTYGAGNNTGTDTVTLNVSNSPCPVASGTVTVNVN
jgi:hypothetical protein